VFPSCLPGLECGSSLVGVRMIGLLKFSSGRQLASSLSTQLRHGSSIKVLLLENVVNRGAKGETVKVYIRGIL
jgi:hypothetical protein